MKLAIRWLCALLACSAMPCSCPAQDPRSPQVALNPAGQSDAPFLIGGTGGAYFLAEPGELVIDLEKHDRNRREIRTDLRAILVGPDRQVLQDVTLPDDAAATRGKIGPAQRSRLTAQVKRKGVYGLNVTVSNDRYGDHVVWGFRTNCQRWLIETARGHRDQRREEPIVLGGLSQPGDVCFLPRRGEFEMEITGLPKQNRTLSVYDAQDQEVAKLNADEKGRAHYLFSAEVARGSTPWRLHLPVQQAAVQIDGVTRWESRDVYPHLACWTPEAKSFFPLLPYRWILTPYQRTVYGPPGQPGQIAFRVHNNADGPRTIRLELEFDAAPWPVELSWRQLKLKAKAAAEVVLQYTVPPTGKTAVCHVRATPAEDADFSTYSTLTVKAGTVPAAQPLSMPLVLKPYQHENEQFGYLPDYPVENQVYFDSQNRPWVRTGSGISTLRDGVWIATQLGAGSVTGLDLPPRHTLAMASSKVAFDRQGDVYLLGSRGRQVALLHSRDKGKTFAAYVLPGREGTGSTWDLEVFTGHNGGEEPPAILRYTRTDADHDPRLRWRSVNDLELFWPRKVDGRIEIGDAVLLSQQCIGLSVHSGIPASVVTRDQRAHVVWGEASDPKTPVPGVPTYVASYDRTRGLLGPAALVAYGPPANDVHNTPSITMDSRGYLHVLAGTHGQPFPYAQSRQPNDAHCGWTEPVPAGDATGLAPGGPGAAAADPTKLMRQTYIGLVCGPDDTLHLACRLWKQGQEPFPAASYGTLAYVRKPAGKPWETPRVLIVPPFSEYSVYYHRLTLDRGGRLYLSYDYYSTYWFYRMDHAGSRRALLNSPDGGHTWRMAAFGQSGL